MPLKDQREPSDRATEYLLHIWQVIVSRDVLISDKEFPRTARTSNQEAEHVMTTKQLRPKDIDDYIASHPVLTQKILKKMRATIRKAAPQARETINYQIPTYTLNGNLVHFAAYKNHIGFYPAPSGIEAFKKELSAYEGAKGSIKFPIDKPLPHTLISKIVKYRVRENMQRAEVKSRACR